MKQKFIFYSESKEVLEAIAKLKRIALSEEDLKRIIREFILLLAEDRVYSEFIKRYKEGIENHKVPLMRDIVLAFLREKLLQ